MNAPLRSLALVACIALVAGCGPLPEEAGGGDEALGEVEQAVTTPAITRGEIMALAQSGVGYSYWWGGGRWDPTQKKYPGKCKGSCPSCSHSATAGGPEYGADCSGYVGQVWQVPKRQAPTGPRPPYSTYHFKNQQTHWYPIKRSELVQGDALVYNSGGKGHVMLFDKWSSGGKVVAYECAGCSIGCVHRPRSAGSEYMAIRRRGIAQPAQPGQPEQPEQPTAAKQPTKGYLDKLSCDGGIQGWARDPDAGKAPIEVVLSFGGPINQSNAAKLTVTANAYRKDLCQALGSCNHAFNVPIPTTMKDGKQRSVYVYAVDSKTGVKKLLIGAPRSFTCGTASSGGKICGHGMCQEGFALSPSCSPCANAVCAKKAACCDTTSGTWDAECVEIAGDTPGACAGICYNGVSSCSHHECVDGVALPASCSTCAASVCERDPFCCNNKWDWICASQAKRDAYCICG
jgi:hypothetical protein